MELRTIAMISAYAIAIISCGLSFRRLRYVEYPLVLVAPWTAVKLLFVVVSCAAATGGFDLGLIPEMPWAWGCVYLFGVGTIADIPVHITLRRERPEPRDARDRLSVWR